MDLHEVTSILARTPSTLERLLADLPPGWLHRHDGPGTWSAYDIVGHLQVGDEHNWMPRVRMILEHGTERPFEPFDREAMLGRQPEPITEVLARFAAARRTRLDELSALSLTAGDLDRQGMHPDFGEVTLGQMLATWVAHDLTHVAQVAEVLAGRYRHEVGPWRVYLPALDRTALAE